MIHTKLDILLNSSVIDKEAYDFAHKVIEFMKSEINSLAETEKADVFYTHLVMAVARQKNNDLPIAELDPDLKEDIKSSEHYIKAKELWKTIESLSPIEFSKEEPDYCYLHICNLLQ